MERPPTPRHTVGAGDPDRRVQVASFAYPLEAHLAAARLRAEGIEASLSGEHTAGLLSGMDCVRLWVREGDRIHALEALASLGPKAASARRSAHFVTDDLAAPRCPRCGGLALEGERPRAFFVAARLLLGVPWPRRRLRCRLCKMRWQPECSS